MSKLIIEGGQHLEGKIKINGSKNAVLPSIAAAVLVKETYLKNVPKIKDVESMLGVVAHLGGSYNWTNGDGLTINTENLVSKPLPNSARKLRASVLFAGPLLARFGEVEMPYPGGDIIGARPLDTHLNGLGSLGAKMLPAENLHIKMGRPTGGVVILEEPSVTATENILLLAAGINHSVEIRLAAAEPHVQDLCRFLVAAGVAIEGIGTTILKINGSKSGFKNVSHEVIPDELEVSAFAVLAAATKSNLILSPVKFEFLDSVTLQLRKMNINFTVTSDSITIIPPASSYKAHRLQSGLYPKLVSDHLPPFAVLATQAEGATLVHEWMYEARQSYIRELMKMGANAMIMDPHRALIIGPTPLYGKEVTSYDIRSGMSMIVAALVAKGQTVISGVEHIDRGYEKLEERLRNIGADIMRIND